ncbi:MAG: hypothetical protein QF657_06830, partial [Candidatus Nitrosopelagicus sp.]|nr:hypothetical protein [Candidatus Nitrosopelagicus sp.]
AAGDNPNIKKISKYSTIEVMTGAIIQKPFDTIIPVEQIKYFPNNLKPKHIILQKKIKKNHIFYIIVLLGIFISNYFYGIYKINKADYINDKNFNVKIISPNFSLQDYNLNNE